MIVEPSRVVSPDLGSLWAGLRQTGVSVPDPDPVAAYLAQHPDLAAVVLAACDAARREFPTGTALSLALYADLDSTDTYLTLYVRQTVYDDEILARIDRLWSAYGPALTEQSGWFLVTTDFAVP